MLDAFYLMSFGRYSLDLDAVDAGKLDLEKLSAMSESFPLRTKKLMRENEYLPAA